MLRAGLTGGLGSGKSTAAQRFAELGAQVLYADEIGRRLMQPGESVYDAIVARFGPGILAAGRQINRAALARLAFGENRIEELNEIVHPATIARQAELIEAIHAKDPDAVVIVESALLFETPHAESQGWRRRFDRIILVRAAEETKIARFVARFSGGAAVDETTRTELAQDARRRLAHQLADDWKAERSDYVITNDGTLDQLQVQVDAIWPLLKQAAGQH
jgi:dephospho-CoA kinase